MADGVSNVLLKVGRHSTRQSGKNGGGLPESELGIVEVLGKRSKDGLRTRRQALVPDVRDSNVNKQETYSSRVALISVQNRVDGIKLVLQSLVGLVTDDVGESHIRKHGLEGLSLLDSRRIVKAQNTDDRSRINSNSSLLDKLRE